MPNEPIYFTQILNEGTISDTLKSAIEKFLPKFMTGRKITDKNNAYELGRQFGEKLKQVRPELGSEVQKLENVIQEEINTNAVIGTGLVAAIAGVALFPTMFALEFAVGFMFGLLNWAGKRNKW